MVVLVISLAMGIIGYAASMAIYRLFLYEESMQEGMMALYTFRITGDGGGTKRVKLAIDEFGIKPSCAELERWGWLVPFVVGPYENFLWAVKMSNSAF